VQVAVLFGAGLLTGLSHFRGPVLVASILAALLAGGRHRIRFLVVALAVAHGWLAVAVEGGRCAARLPQGRIAVTVHAVDPAGFPAPARATLPDVECSGTIDVRWPERILPVVAGTVAQVEGRWIPRTRALGRRGGTLLISRAEARDTAPSLAQRLRNATVSTSLRLYGDRAPLVDALVLGTRGGMDRELKDDFARSGLVHLLSISGFHVGLLAAWVVMALSAAGFPRQRAMGVGALAGVAYVVFLGWPAPAGRAAALCCVLALCLRRQRHTDSGSLLAVTALAVMLVDPWAIVDLGGWLSVSALWGATTATRWSDRAFGTGFLPRTLGSSIGATLATAPITAAGIGTVALAGVLMNILAIPLAAVAVPGVVASLVVAPLASFVASPLAAGSGLALHGLEWSAHWGAAIPLGHGEMPAELESALPWMALLGVALWAIGPRNTRVTAARRLAIAALAASGLTLGQALPARSRDESLLTLHFLDVGQGDAAAIRTPGGHWVLVDAGPRDERYDAGRRVVAPFLARAGARRISAVVVSHAHLDHVGGVPAILERFPVDAVLEPGDLVADDSYDGFLGAVAASGARWVAVRAGAAFALDSVEFRVIHPDTSWAQWGLDLNEDSAVLLVEYREFRALLAGDAGWDAEQRLLGSVGPVDLLKVGHHGSATASGTRWLEELDPEVAVISVGRNRYGHPSREALERLAAAGSDVWRTDRDGTITVATDGRTMQLSGRDRDRKLRVDPEESMP
jgi:competence protein ComEC